MHTARVTDSVRIRVSVRKLYDLSHGSARRMLMLHRYRTPVAVCIASFPIKQSIAKQRCVMGVSMCLYAQLVQTKKKQYKSAIILQCYHPHLSDFCSRPWLTLTD